MALLVGLVAAAIVASVTITRCMLRLRVYAISLFLGRSEEQGKIRDEVIHLMNSKRSLGDMRANRFRCVPTAYYPLFIIM